MQSTVRLFNTALARLGGEQLVLNLSPLEQGTTGQICENLFSHVLEMTLVSHSWSFATLRKVLSTPVLVDTLRNPEYPFVFDLPADCVKPLHIEGYAGVNRTPAYVIEGNTIRASRNEATFVYVSRVEDPRLWPPFFADALAWGLAGELASAINNDREKQAWCYQNHRIALADAVAQDQGNQNPQPKRSEWTAARHGEGGY